MGEAASSGTVLNKEPAVAGHIVLPVLAIVHAAADDPRLKQRHRRARLQRRARGRARSRDSRRHHLAVRPDVVQLLAVGPPPRMDAARCRHLPLSTGAVTSGTCSRRRHERPHVDLLPSRLVGHVRHPAPVRRELRPALSEVGLQEQPRLAVSFERQHPGVPAGLRIDAVIQKFMTTAPVLAKIARILAVFDETEHPTSPAASSGKPRHRDTGKNTKGQHLLASVPRSLGVP